MHGVYGSGACWIRLTVGELPGESARPNGQPAYTAMRLLEGFGSPLPAFLIELWSEHLDTDSGYSQVKSGDAARAGPMRPSTWLGSIPEDIPVGHEVAAGLDSVSVPPGPGCPRCVRCRALGSRRTPRRPRSAPALRFGQPPGQVVRMAVSDRSAGDERPAANGYTPTLADVHGPIGDTLHGVSAFGQRCRAEGTRPRCDLLQPSSSSRRNTRRTSDSASSSTVCTVAAPG